MGRNPTILFVVNDPAFFLSHRLSIARAGKRRGVEIHVATPLEDCVKCIKDEGFIHHPLKLKKHGTSIIFELITIIGIYRIFKSLKPDLVHLVTIKPVIYGGIAARLSKIPSVVSAISGLGHLFIDRGVVVSILRKIAMYGYRLALKHPCQKVIFQNSDDLNFFLKYKLVDKSKTIIIKGSGVDVDLFLPTQTPAGPPIVLLAGRMQWEKGIATFVQAAKKILQLGVLARFVLVGGRDSWNVSTIPLATLDEWQKEGVVEWWGRQSNMPEILGSSTLVCLPSHREGLPKVLIEAAACGKAIVATDVPGCREVVLDGENGLLVPAENVDALVDALIKLLKDVPLRISMGKVGRELAVNQFCQALVVDQTFEVYDSLFKQINMK